MSSLDINDVTVNPLVSIIVRTKDRPKLLKKALQSIYAQTYRPIEVALVNDGGCRLDIGELKAILHDVRLNYIRLEQNRGRAHAGNIGLENTSGEYIGFLDDDDELYLDHLKVLTAKLVNSTLKIAHTDAEVVFVDISGEDEIVEKFKYEYYSQDFSPEMLLIQNYIPFMCLLFNRSVFHSDYVRFDESFEIFEDWKILIKLSEKYWFEHIKKITARYIQWCDKSQINRRALSEKFSQVAYKKILNQNIDKITPAAIYIHCVNNATEKIKLTNELIRIESKHSLERMEIETKIRRIEAEKDELLAERDVLLNELMSFRKEFSDSLGWKLIIRYRKLKDRIAPLRSKRRVFYEMLLKSIKVSRQEGMKGLFFRVRRRVRIHSGLLNYKSTLGKFKPLSFSAESKIRETHCFVKKPVQIIMPVYNGYEYLKDCIKSIFLNTDLKSHTLVIIDDSSTDSRVTAYLKELEEGRDGKRIEILFNTNNQGFVKTINRGMKLSPGDVIILNSDTLVTKNWVDKLRRAAYSKPRVATATPLSNYMTINGIPKPFQYNAIPSGMNVDTFAAFLEDISLLYYPEVPAGVGFCMYIKRDVLEQLGYFDETKFEKGYAEETDFCMRALKQGFVHVLDDSTYIYHVGGVSFESVRDPEIIREKNLMIERNLETLRTLHPEYSSLVKKALDENLAPVHKYINMRAKLMERKLESTLCDRSKT
jgi:GT2 family glycosyltransferase